jgi:hypothetical protein
MGDDAMSFYKRIFKKISKPKAKIIIHLENNNEHKKDNGTCGNFMVKKNRRVWSNS